VIYSILYKGEPIHSTTENRPIALRSEENGYYSFEFCTGILHRTKTLTAFFSEVSILDFMHCCPKYFTENIDVVTHVSFIPCPTMLCDFVQFTLSTKVNIEPPLFKLSNPFAPHIVEGIGIQTNTPWVIWLI